MANLEIPPYDSIVPNQIFAKISNSEEFKHMDLIVNDIIKIDKFIIPSKDFVIGYINTQIDDAINDKSPDALINKLPEEYKQRLNSHIPRIKESLTNDFPYKGSLKLNNLYLSCTFTNLPTCFDDIINSYPVENRAFLYDKIMKDQGINDWTIIVNIENNEFPDKKTLEFLLSYGVRDSDVFSIKGVPSNYSSIANHLLILQNALKNKKSLEKVFDSTVAIQEVFSSACYNVFYTDLMKKFGLDNLLNMLDITINREPGEEKKSYPDFLNGFGSIN